MEMQLSLTDLPQFAARFWEEIGNTKVILFHGLMGAGKTTTIAALCQSKGVKDVTGSPTFSIINEYRYDEGSKEKSIFHIDLYRLKDIEETIQAGVEDCVYSGAYCFIEWPEKAPELFDEQVIHVLIKVLHEDSRQIKILSDAAFQQLSVTEQL
ncbi:MAG TPA: tRNA (adenosine(37)-N6)-threonylcarbamoyltransferase complex ATPase subunit type 1 TsaE [Flavisolibacter sp.]|nr:tRNA (adenosine(37)-N6)-threonylcarbamoyltransferase complex ATPase subunit type 1 TsaE [Flavisolibacter sp.]